MNRRREAGQPNPIPLNERRYMPSFLPPSLPRLSRRALSTAPIEQDLWMFPMGPYFIDFAGKFAAFHPAPQRRNERAKEGDQAHENKSCYILFTHHMTHIYDLIIHKTARHSCLQAGAKKNYPCLNFPPKLLPAKVTNPCRANLPISEISS